MKLKYLMCNLKSNKTLKEMLEYKKNLPNLEAYQNIEFVLFPTCVYLSFFYDVSYKMGSQNLSVYETGPFTGEILANQLKSLKVSYILVNHFESKDTLKEVVIKVQNAVKYKMKVVLCIGEKKRQTMDETLIELKKEIHSIFSSLTQLEKENIILAYEPCWTINKQDIINTNVINNIAYKIKNEIKQKYDCTLPILYGGGINTKNIKELTKVDNIDGYLLGNCANNPENICKVLENL